MLALRPMTEEEYTQFMAVLEEEYPRDRSRNLGTPLEEERVASLKQINDLLPQGLRTPGHFFWTVAFFSSVTSQTIKGVFEPVRDFALRPHLALFVIVLGYFQGATLRWRRLTTLAILLCGLGMIFAVPGLYIGADWELARWRLLLPITPRDVAILAIYFGLNVAAGALVVAGAWRRLRLLDPHGRALSWLWRRHARAAIA